MTGKEEEKGVRARRKEKKGMRDDESSKGKNGVRQIDRQKKGLSEGQETRLCTIGSAKNLIEKATKGGIVSGGSEWMCIALGKGFAKMSELLELQG